MLDIPAVEILGLVAGAFTAFTSLPQTYKIIKSKDAQSVSLLTFVMFHISCILWLIYGIIMASISIIFWNVISFCTTGSVVVLKILDMRRNYKER